MQTWPINHRLEEPREHIVFRGFFAFVFFINVHQKFLFHFLSFAFLSTLMAPWTDWAWPLVCFPGEASGQGHDDSSSALTTCSRMSGQWSAICCKMALANSCSSALSFSPFSNSSWSCKKHTEAWSFSAIKRVHCIMASRLSSKLLHHF